MIFSNRTFIPKLYVLLNRLFYFSFILPFIMLVVVVYITNRNQPWSPFVFFVESLHKTKYLWKYKKVFHSFWWAPINFLMDPGRKKHRFGKSFTMKCIISPKNTFPAKPLVSHWWIRIRNTIERTNVIPITDYDNFQWLYSVKICL